MIARPKSAVFNSLRHNGIALLVAIGLFGLTYGMVFNLRTSPLSGGYDYLAHALWAIEMTPQDVLSSFYDGSEHLWHVCVKLLLAAGVSNMWTAAAVVTAAANAAAYFLIYRAWEQALPEKPPRWLLALLVAAGFLAASLTVPGCSFYTGRGAVNTWHNPTNIMVRPFAAAVFYMTVRIYNRRRYGCHALLLPGAKTEALLSDGFLHQLREPVYTRAELVLYPLCLLFSAYSKPSFLQFFAPAIFLFLVVDLIRTKGRLFPFCLKLALAYVPAGLILLSQFFSFFSSGVSTSSGGQEVQAAASSGIAVYFISDAFAGAGDFVRSFGKSLLLLLCPCAFPLFIFIISGKSRTAALSLGLTGACAGWLEAQLLHETGSRAADGNFGWGCYLSAWLFFTAAIGQYAALLPQNSRAGKLARWVGTPLLLWHLAAGVCYIVRILQTGEYYF